QLMARRIMDQEARQGGAEGEVLHLLLTQDALRRVRTADPPPGIRRPRAHVTRIERGSLPERGRERQEQGRRGARGGHFPLPVPGEVAQEDRGRALERDGKAQAERTGQL